MSGFLSYIWLLLILRKLAVILASICSMSTWEHAELLCIHSVLYKLTYVFVCMILECLYLNLGKSSSFPSPNQNSKHLCSFWLVVWLACSHPSLVWYEHQEIMSFCFKWQICLCHEYLQTFQDLHLNCQSVTAWLLWCVTLLAK